MENTKGNRLLFKSSWGLSYFWHSNWLYFRKSCKTTLFRKPTDVSQNMPTFISIRLPIINHKNKGTLKMWKICYFWWLFFRIKNCWHLEFSIIYLIEITGRCLMKMDNMSKTWFTNKFGLQLTVYENAIF